MCHQHTDLGVKVPPLFFKLSHVNFEQVDDYQYFRQPSLGGRALGGQGRALPLWHSPWGQCHGFPSVGIEPGVEVQ